MWVEGKFLLKKGAYQDTIDLLSPKIFDWITNIHADSGMSKPEWLGNSVHDLALAHMKLERWEEALHFAKAAILYWPAVDYSHSENYYQTLARIYLQLGRLDLARATLWGIANLNKPNSPEHNLQFGFQQLIHYYVTTAQSAQAALVTAELRSISAAQDPAIFFLEATLHFDPSSAWRTSAAATQDTNLSERPASRGRGRATALLQWISLRRDVCDKISFLSPAESSTGAWLMDLPVWTEHEIDSLIGFGSGPRPSSSWITEISDTEISDKQCDEIDSQELNQGLDSGSQPQKVSRDRAINHAMERENGAIVYLCCGDEAEVRDLEKSLSLLTKFMIGISPYPIIILHDFLNKDAIQKLRRAILPPLIPESASTLSERLLSTQAPIPVVHFVWLGEEDWHGVLPPDVSRKDKIFGYGIGYRHMCRFFSGPPLANLGALKSYEWLLRMDTDSFLLGPVSQDPIRLMSQHQFLYGWLSAFTDESYYVTGLWETTKEWLSNTGLGNEQVKDWIAPYLSLRNQTSGHGDWNDVRFCFTSNFFVVNANWFRSPIFQSYFRHLEQSGGFYRYRWGDACVHFMAVAIMLDRRYDTGRFVEYIPYWHQGTVVMPEFKGSFAHADI